MKYTTCTCGHPGWTTVKCCNACGLPVDGQHWHIPELTEARERIKELEAANAILAEANAILAEGMRELTRGLKRINANLDRLKIGD